MIDLDRQPSARELRWFGWLPLAFFALLGALLLWRTRSPAVAAIPFALGAALGGLSWALPPLRRPLHRAWMRAFAPVGWAVSHLALASIFYGIVTPIGLALRALGRDPLRKSPEPGAESHWLPRPGGRDTRRYFRQS